MESDQDSMSDPICPSTGYPATASQLKYDLLSCVEPVDCFTAALTDFQDRLIQGGVAEEINVIGCRDESIFSDNPDHRDAVIPKLPVLAPPRKSRPSGSCLNS